MSLTRLFFSTSHYHDLYSNAPLVNATVEACFQHSFYTI